MKIISLWEPWATLMALGKKRIETRSWRTPYVGWLAIHASKGGLSKADLRRALQEDRFSGALAGESPSPGCIVAVVYLVSCEETAARGHIRGVFDLWPELDTPAERAFGNYEIGRYAWVTGRLFRLPTPIPYRAHQGLYDLESPFADGIRTQMNAARAENK